MIRGCNEREAKAWLRFQREALSPLAHRVGERDLRVCRPGEDGERDRGRECLYCSKGRAHPEPPPEVRVSGSGWKVKQTRGSEAEHTPRHRFSSFTPLLPQLPSSAAAHTLSARAAHFGGHAATQRGEWGSGLACHILRCQNTAPEVRRSRRPALRTRGGRKGWREGQRRCTGSARASRRTRTARPSAQR